VNLFALLLLLGSGRCEVLANLVQYLFYPVSLEFQCFLLSFFALFAATRQRLFTSMWPAGNQEALAFVILSVLSPGSRRGCPPPNGNHNAQTNAGAPV
jgi:hypothetical protein